MSTPNETREELYDMIEVMVDVDDVTPTLTKHERALRAEALREAAAVLDVPGTINTTPTGRVHVLEGGAAEFGDRRVHMRDEPTLTDWLRARADQIEAQA